MCKLRLSGIVKESIVDGPGIRFAIFVQGCSHNCKGCHNPGTHDYNGGYEDTIENIFKDIKNNHIISGVTFSGGEPLDQARSLSELAKRIKTLNLNILIYTGYTMEYILKNISKNEYWKSLLIYSDTVIDGPFIIEERSLDLKFRGSLNQRIIDSKEFLQKLL